MTRFPSLLCAALLLITPPLVAAAQTTADQDDMIPMQSHCIALADNAFSAIRFASFGADLSSEEVRLSYVNHSTFLIETPGGHGIATDFTGFIGTDVIPDVVTMNNAHSTHWTANPDPRIPHVLRGWADENGAADHRVTLDGEVLIRNVPTDVRSGFEGRRENGNSIFIIEVAGLCIGHLGHLHHEPTEAQYAAIGRLDVVMAAVDGGMTLDLTTMTRVLTRLRASVVLPMHWFGRSTLGAFVSGMSETYKVEVVDGNATTVTLRDLPRQPTIRVLNPSYIAFPE